MKKRYLKKTISPYKDEIYEYEDEGFKKLLNIIKEYSTLILSSAAFFALFLTYLYEFIHTSLLNVNTEYIQVDSGIIGYVFLFLFSSIIFIIAFLSGDYVYLILV